MIEKNSVSLITIPFGTTGLILTVAMSLDKTAPVVINTSRVSEIGNGFYAFFTTIAETNGEVLSILATAPPDGDQVYEPYYASYQLGDEGAEMANLQTTIRHLDSKISLMPLSVPVPLQSITEPVTWFTTAYTVLYTIPSQLRILLGSTIVDFSDEVLYTHIFNASIAENVRTLGSTASLADLSVPNASPTFAITRSALLRAAISVLNSRIAELSSESTDRTTLGDFTIQRTNDHILSLQGLIATYTSELTGNAAGRVSIRYETMPSVSTWTQPTLRSTF